MVWSGARASARRISVLLSIALATTAIAAVPGAGAETAAPQSRVAYQQWTSAHDFAKGSSEGVRAAGSGAITIARTVGTTSYTDPYGGGTKNWDYARWTSPTVPVSFGATQLVA